MGFPLLNSWIVHWLFSYSSPDSSFSNPFQPLRESQYVFVKIILIHLHRIIDSTPFQLLVAVWRGEYGFVTKHSQPIVIDLSFGDIVEKHEKTACSLLGGNRIRKFAEKERGSRS